jgi:D(-)-tartrate dehydratase
MKIRDIRERTISLGSPIRNAYVDFSTMTASLVAIETDEIRNGRPVTGYGFSSPVATRKGRSSATGPFAG